MVASSNLTLGKGEVYFAPFTAGTKDHTGYLFLGNCPEFTLNLEVENLEHFSSTSGLREKDESIVVSRTMGGGITCDDINYDNLAFFFMGAKSTVTATSATGSTHAITANQGRVYQLGETTAKPTGDRSVTAVVVTNTATPATIYTLTTDYLVDAELGLITIVSGGGIADGTGVTATYNVTATTRTRVVSGETEVEGAMKFVSRNPAGNLIDYALPWVKMRSNGDFSLITEEFTTIGLNLEVLKNGNLSLLYGDGRPVV